MRETKINSRSIKLFLVFAFLVVVRILVRQSAYHTGDLIRVKGRIYSEPNYYISAQIVNLHGVRAKFPRYPEIELGDEIVLEGRVEDDYISEAHLVQQNQSNLFIYKLRRKIIAFYQQNLPSPHAGLVSGVVLGSKQGLSAAFYEQLKRSGTVHIVVASGMNVTLVASFLLESLVYFISRRRAVLIAIFGVWTYVFMAGFDAPLVRAAIMGSIAFSALKLGRTYDAWRGLGVSAFVMLMINPGFLGNLGFILSFTATASLMLFEKTTRRLVRFLPHIFQEGLSTSLAAQIGVAPILFYSFGEFNLLSPIINALVLWTISYITVIGMVGGIVGLVVPQIGRLILFVIYPLIEYFLFIVYRF